MHVVRWIRF